MKMTCRRLPQVLRQKCHFPKQQKCERGRGRAENQDFTFGYSMLRCLDVQVVCQEGRARHYSGHHHELGEGIEPMQVNLRLGALCLR